MTPRATIATANAPAAIGPYSQAIRAGGLLFVSGQIPLRPDGTMVDGDTAVQTRQVLDNLKAIVTAAGLRLEDVVKCTVYLANMDDFAAMNAVYQEFFGRAPPARAAVQVARLPRNVLVEIDAIAHGA